MGKDYYPKLSETINNTEKTKKLVTQQAEISILIIAPVIVIFFLFSDSIIELLYSKQFSLITTMIAWAILGTFFRATSWCMGFMIIAKGDSSLFLKTSISFNSLFLINNIVGYTIYGLEGLGISFFLNYIIHFSVLLILTGKIYKFLFEKKFFLLFTLGFFLCLLAFGSSFLKNEMILRYSTGGFIVVLTLIFSWINLNKKLDIKDMLKRLIK